MLVLAVVVVNSHVIRSTQNINWAFTRYSKKCSIFFILLPQTDPQCSLCPFQFPSSYISFLQINSVSLAVVKLLCPTILFIWGSFSFMPFISLPLSSSSLGPVITCGRVIHPFNKAATVSGWALFRQRHQYINIQYMVFLNGSDYT